jgi:uncharacterized phage protein gp47/JayE
MAVQTQTFAQIVQGMAAYVQSTAAALLDVSVGSVLRALVESYASVIVWLESLILQVLTLTRAATSVGADLDSWMADYGVGRLAAVAAAGAVTFGRLSSSGQVVVPVGATVQTGDGTQGFVVTVDGTNGAYVAGVGYVMGNGTSAVNVPVVASNPGTVGNVLAGSISVITTSIAGVDNVTNALAFGNGVAAESDTALRARFILYLQSLSMATKTAVGAAIGSVRQGLVYALVENADYNGTVDYGYFYVVVDDGTGSPGSTLLGSVSTAIEAVRGCGVRFGVFAPVVVNAAISMTLTTAAGYTHSAVVAGVSAALQSTINGLGLGVSLPFTQIAAIAYTVPGVVNVTSVTLNAGAADLAATSQQVIKTGTLVVN